MRALYFIFKENDIRCGIIFTINSKITSIIFSAVTETGWIGGINSCNIK